LVPVFFHILYTECAKVKKKIRCQRGNNYFYNKYYVRHKQKCGISTDILRALYLCNWNFNILGIELKFPGGTATAAETCGIKNRLYLIEDV